MAVQMDRELRARYGEWALVTGASSGIGEAFARVLGRRGINLILLSNDPPNLERTRQELRDANPGLEVISRALDLADLDALRAYVRDAETRPVRIVVNCAGVGYAGHTLNGSLEEFLRMAHINAGAVLVLSYHFADAFVRDRVAGAIINISTANVEAGLPTPFSAVYTSLKTFVKYFSESLAYEMRPYAVDVMNVSCGPTTTGFQGHAGTRTLAWSETAESVAVKSLDALGRRTTIVTNPVSRVIIACARHLPLPRRVKIRLAAAYFGTLLGQGQRLTPERKPEAACSSVE